MRKIYFILAVMVAYSGVAVGRNTDLDMTVDTRNFITYAATTFSNKECGILGNAEFVGVVARSITYVSRRINADYDITISDCYNTGNVSSDGNHVGGVLGEGLTLPGGPMYAIKNVYNIGSISGVGSNIGGVSGNRTNSIHKGNLFSVLDCVILGSGGNDGIQRPNDMMKSSSFVNILNAKQSPPLWVVDTKNINQGYPIFNWQVVK